MFNLVAPRQTRQYRCRYSCLFKFTLGNAGTDVVETVGPEPGPSDMDTPPNGLYATIILAVCASIVLPLEKLTSFEPHAKIAFLQLSGAVVKAQSHRAYPSQCPSARSESSASPLHFVAFTRVYGAYDGFKTALKATDSAGRGERRGRTRVHAGRSARYIVSVMFA